MKILVLLSRVPYPLEKGDKLRAFHQIKRLSENHKIILCCLNDKELHPEALSHLKPYCEEVRVIQLNKVKIGLNLFKGLFSRLPFQVLYFYHKNVQKEIDRLIEKEMPRHIYCQLIRVSSYVTKYSIIPKTLDYMDAFSKGAERRIKFAPYYMKPFLKIESRRLQRFESRMFPLFSNKTIISEQDKQQIRHPEKEKIHVIPNGIDTGFFKPIERKKDFDLLFTGNMSYPPNVESALYIAHEILPLVWKKYPDTTFLISGATPTSPVKALSNKKITVTGWVNDIRESYARAKIFIAPMQIGTGLQNKLLEAMAMQLPCVTSKLANNALGATHDKNILIGSTAEEYANNIIRLIENHQLNNKITEEGYCFVSKEFNWDHNTRLLEKIIINTG